jgi:argininosuccinate lyase
VMKGLPLAYSKDMQEDKEPFFDALDSLSLALVAAAGMVDDMEPDRAAMMRAATLGFSTATDLADWLVRVLGLPFREAHHVTGRLVAMAEQRGIDLKDLDLAEMQKVDPGITADAIKVLSVENSVASRRSFGGTAPANVARQARAWLKTLNSKQ